MPAPAASLCSVGRTWMTAGRAAPGPLGCSDRQAPRRPEPGSVTAAEGSPRTVPAQAPAPAAPRPSARRGGAAAAQAARRAACRLRVRLPGAARTVQQAPTRGELGSGSAGSGSAGWGSAASSGRRGLFGRPGAGQRAPGRSGRCAPPPSSTIGADHVPEAESVTRPATAVLSRPRRRRPGRWPLPGLQRAALSVRAWRRLLVGWAASRTHRARAMSLRPTAAPRLDACSRLGTAARTSGDRCRSVGRRRRRRAGRRPRRSARAAVQCPSARTRASGQAPPSARCRIPMPARRYA